MRRGQGHDCAVGRRLVVWVAAAWLAGAAPALAANDALLKLLQVLRDRGSISSQEYDDIRKVAEVAEAPEAPTEVAKRLGTVEQRLAAQDKAVAGLKALENA